MASAGRILIMPKGNYDSSATYEMLDMVHYNGTSWLAKKTAKDIEPSAANSEHWHNMVDLNIVNNLETTEEGGVLDARQGKVLNDKIDNLNSTVKLFSTAEDFSTWTIVTLSELYTSFKYIYMELRDLNDGLIDSVFIPSQVFSNYNAGESKIILKSDDVVVTAITQSPSTMTIAKVGGKFVVWGVERIS